MAAKRKATVTWNGDLMSGSGRVSLDSSGAARDLPVTWASRTETASGGPTSPEELIAGAFAACFSMALSHALAQAGSKPERLDVEATSNFEKGDEGFRFSTIDLRVRGSVPGMDDGAFRKAAEAASQNCPVAKALRGNVEISVDAALA